MQPGHVIRPARPDELALLREVERDAGERFRDQGLPEIADDEPQSISDLAGYAAEGRCLVAVDEGDRPIGYLLIEVVDDAAHIEQVSVRPEGQGQGAGKALIGAASQWAARHRLGALTLTTFAEVPWNRPLYEHLGFRVLAEAELGPGLRDVRARETAHGLDPARRVVMRREISGAG